MSISIKDIKELLDEKGLEFKYFGDSEILVESFSMFTNPDPGTVIWVKDINKFDSRLNVSSLLIVTGVIPPGFMVENMNVLSATHSKAVFFEILSVFYPPSEQIRGIAETAIIKTKNIGQNVTIGHYSYIGAEVSIGNNTKILNNVSIQCEAKIGCDCIIESGVVIGEAGYGYYKIPGNNIKKVPDYGGVIIGDRVEIGANVSIAKGTLGNTIIGNDVKIGTLCHVGHNSIIEQNSFIMPTSIILGSCKIQRDAYIAPCAVIMNGKTVGANALVGMGSVVTRSVKEGTVVTGFPAAQIPIPLDIARGGI